MRVECLRAAVLDLLAACERVHPDPRVLERASWPMPTGLGTLGAIHLATALLGSDLRGEPRVFATHDPSLGTAARASGLEVVGLRASGLW